MSFWGSLASAGAAIFGTMQSNKNIDKQISAQRQENEKMRKYNLDLAKMQNEWSRNQWQMENAYNSPSAQIERMREAGLNPDMMYGGGVSGNLSAYSPSMTSGAAATPMDFSSLANKKTIGDAILGAKQLELMDAQIENVKADSDKKGAETSILNSDAAFRDEFNRGLLATQNMDIRVKSKGLELTDQQIKESQARIRSIDANIGYINTQIEQIRVQMAESAERLDLDKALNDAKIKQIASECNLNYAQAKSINDQLEKVLRNMDDEHDISLLNQASLRIANGKADFDARFTGSTKEWDSTMSAYDNIIKYIRRALDAIPLTGSFSVGKVIK